MRLTLTFIAIIYFTAIPSPAVAAETASVLAPGTTWEYTFSDPTSDADWATRPSPGWSIGTAPFGSSPQGLDPNFKANTNWPADGSDGDDLWLRKSVDISAFNVNSLKWSLGVDNGFKLFVNGKLVSSGNAEGYASRWEYSGTIPADAIGLDYEKMVVAVALEDHGGETAFDMMITGDLYPTGSCNLVAANAPLGGGSLPDDVATVDTIPLDRYLHQPGKRIDFETGEGLPSWWTEEDTKRFLDELPKQIEKEITDAASDAANEKVAERAVGDATRKLIARKLAEGEARIVRDRLIKCGRDPEVAEKIAKRLARRLEKEYLYNNPKLLDRIIPFKRGIASLRKLLKSPKTWLRGKIGKVFVKGLGKLGGRIFGVAGLVDDLYTIGQACWYGYQASVAIEGAKQQWQECREVHQDLIDFRAGLSPAQQDQIRDLYEREERYFRRAEEHILPIVEP